jgi:hypothetical protein
VDATAQYWEPPAMDNNGKPRNQNEDLEQRIYQVLALLDRAGEQQRAAADTLARAGALVQRIDQGMQIASGAAAKRIAEEARSALDGAIADSAERLRQAARGAVAAAENLRQPWWMYLVMLLVTGSSAPRWPSGQRILLILPPIMSCVM